MNIKWSVSLI